MVLDSVTRRLIALALEEDLGPGDVTSACVPEATRGTATVLARTALVLAGTEAFIEVFHQVDREAAVEFFVREGTEVSANSALGRVNGPARALLAAERTALNILQRMCGVATMSRRAASAVRGTKARVVDTRKTTPGMRALEKHAVRIGGATNHRIGLFDGVLIKDNHVRAAGGVSAAIEAAKRAAHHLLKIECEVTTLAELEQALAAKADVVLLDNMDLVTMRRAVEINQGRAVLEASGGVTLEKLGAIAATGVDLISMGALTHSAPAADIALEWS
jgi:nicotinate-nucleotide pyrophosphorylase (carboxylating)